MPDKLHEALSLSEEILNGLEAEELSISSAALRCLRIARLISDVDSIRWLQFENSGYPTTKEGFIDGNAFIIGCEHRRETEGNDKGRTGFFKLAKEFETTISSLMASINTITTQGVSISGDYTNITMTNLLNTILKRTSSYSQTINDAEHCLTILKGQYYSYALKVNLELKFSKHAEDIFQSYRMKTDTNLLAFAPGALTKLNAAYDNLKSDNPESWSQALASCRRVFQEISDVLFKKVISLKDGEKYITQSGKTLDIAEKNYKNKLYAIVDFLSKSKTSRQLIGSEILLLIDWIERLHELMSKGVHEIENPLDYDEARSGVLRTYILLGSLANLVENNENITTPE